MISFFRLQIVAVTMVIMVLLTPVSLVTKSNVAIQLNTAEACDAACMELVKWMLQQAISQIISSFSGGGGGDSGNIDPRLLQQELDLLNSSSTGNIDERVQAELDKLLQGLEQNDDGLVSMDELLNQQSLLDERLDELIDETDNNNNNTELPSLDDDLDSLLERLNEDRNLPPTDLNIDENTDNNTELPNLNSNDNGPTLTSNGATLNAPGSQTNPVPRPEELDLSGDEQSQTNQNQEDKIDTSELTDQQQDIWQRAEAIHTAARNRLEEARDRAVGAADGSPEMKAYVDAYNKYQYIASTVREIKQALLAGDTVYAYASLGTIDSPDTSTPVGRAEQKAYQLAQEAVAIPPQSAQKRQAYAVAYSAINRVSAVARAVAVGNTAQAEEILNDIRRHSTDGTETADGSFPIYTPPPLPGVQIPVESVVDNPYFIITNSPDSIGQADLFGMFGGLVQILTFDLSTNQPNIVPVAATTEATNSQTANISLLTGAQVSNVITPHNAILARTVGPLLRLIVE